MKLENLGDLRALVEYLGGQSDEVPIRLVVPVPGMSVDTGSFPTGPETAQVNLRANGRYASVGQTPGYHQNMGPAAYIQIEGIVP